MLLRPLILGVLLAPLAHSQDAPRAIQIAEAPESAPSAGGDRVLSSTGQFRVTGGEALQRASVASLAEETKSELLRLTGEASDGWKVPVSITLHGRPGDPLPLRTVGMRLLVTDAGFELQMDVHLSRGVEHERFKHTATAALLYERSLRTMSSAETETKMMVPPWLVDGLREASDWRLGRSERRLYEALFRSGGLFKTEDLFALEEPQFEDLDGASRSAFRISSGSLVMALLEQPQGLDGFRAFINEVASYQGEMPSLLRKHFPELNLSEKGLSKWWMLQMANKGMNQLTDILSVTQTESALSEALRLNFRTPEGITQQKELDAWPELAALKDPERLAAVRPAQDALVRLSYRCFPSYRPILAEYQLVLGNIARNKTKDTPASIKSLSATRETMVAKAARARDFLDWFEITRARETSGVFDDYIRLKDRLKANPHQRLDEMSKYLDRMDAIFSRGLPDPVAPAPRADLSAPPDLLLPGSNGF